MTASMLFESATTTVAPCVIEFCTRFADHHAGLCPACGPLFGPYAAVLASPGVTEQPTVLDTVERPQGEKLAHGDADGAQPSQECSTIS